MACGQHILVSFGVSGVLEDFLLRSVCHLQSVELRFIPGSVGLLRVYDDHDLG